MATLHQLANKCKFGPELDHNLRDRLVHGMYEDTMRRHLQKEADLTLDEAVKIVSAMEAAAHGAEQITVQVDDVAISHIVSEPAQRCFFFCGGPHQENTCRSIGRRCFKCQKRGHFAQMCTNKNSVVKQTSDRRARHMHTIVDNAEGTTKAAAEDYDSDAATVGKLWVLRMAPSPEMNSHIT